MIAIILTYSERQNTFNTTFWPSAYSYADKSLEEELITQ